MRLHVIAAYIRLYYGGTLGTEWPSFCTSALVTTLLGLTWYYQMTPMSQLRPQTVGPCDEYVH